MAKISGSDDKRRFPIDPDKFNKFKKELNNLNEILNKFNSNLNISAANWLNYQDAINSSIKTINQLNRTNKYKLNDIVLSKENIIALQKSIDLLEDYVDKEEYILKVEKERAKERDKALRERKTNAFQKEYSDYYNRMLNNDKLNFKSLLNQTGSRRYNEQIYTAQKIEDEIQEKLVRKYANAPRKGRTNEQIFKDMQKDINEQTIDALKQAGLDKSSAQLLKAAEIWNTVGDVFISLLDSAWKLTKEGYQRQVRIYEDTFSNISTRSGMTRSTYFQNQLRTSSQLRSRGLFDNVGVSEVQEIWNNLANLGMSDTNILINGIDNVITQKIVPYLDTSSLNFNLLNSRLNNQFVKDIRGINLANQDLAHNNYLTQNLLNQIIDEVQPMSDKAIQDLALNSTEAIAMLNKLTLPTSEGGAGLSDSQAKEYLSKAFQLQKYRGQTLRNGSVYEKRAVISAESQGINDLPSLISTLVATNIGLSDIVPNYDTNPLIASLSAEALYGANSYDLAMAGQKLQGINTADFFADILNMTPDQLQAYNEQVSKRLQRGDYNTATQMQEYLASNIATPIATISQQIGRFGTDIVSGIGDILKAIIGTPLANVIGSALGVNGASGGLTTLLGGAGPIVLGIGAVAGIATAIYNSQRGENEENALGYGARLQSLNTASSFDTGELSVEDLVSNTDAAQGRGNIGMFQGATEINMYRDKAGNIHTGAMNDSDYSLLKVFDSRSDELATHLGFDKNFLLEGSSEASEALKKFLNDKDAGKYNNIKTAALSLAVNNNSDALKMSLLHAALLVEGYEDKLYNDPNITNPLSTYLGLSLSQDKDYISNYLTAAGITKYSDLQTVYNWLSNKSTDFYLMRSNGQFYDYPKGNEIAKIKEDFNLHRQGLAQVPYDNYPALLHAGETIMTASTTATMENMIQAFKESQSQNYRIDAAIQEQTAQLIAKMDEIINNMNSSISTPVNTNSVQANLRKSLVSMTSTIGFNAYRN